MNLEKKGWRQVEIGEFMIRRRGSVNPKKYQHETFQLYSIPAYDAGEPEIIKGKDIGSSKKKVETHDVLLSRIVPHIRRCWVIEDNSKYRKIGSGEWMIFNSHEVDKHYLKYFFLSDFFSAQFLKDLRGVGGSLLRANPELTGKIQIPLPPLPEQRRLAALLDRADALRRRDEALLEQYEALGRSLFLEMFGDPVRNERGWEVKKLKNISTKILSGNTPKGGSNVYVEKGILFFRSQNVWRNSLEFEDVAYIDKDTHEKMSKSSLKNGDILMTKTGRINTENSSLGRAALFLGEDDSANINGHVYLIRLTKNITKEFVLFILTTREYRDYIRSVCVGGIDKRQINCLVLK